MGNKIKTPEQLRLENIMGNCIGTERYYYSDMMCYKYTDGVKTFANEAGAYWFLMELNQFIIKLKGWKDVFVSFVLSVKDNKCKILQDKKVVKEIGFTDCPDGNWEFFYYSNDNLLIWNMEY